MKLYYATGTCSFAPHVALREAGIPFTLIRYDMAAATLDGGGKLTDVNEKGFVPVLELDDGERLTEVPVVLQYIADLKPGSALAPAAGTMARYRLQEFLNFLGTEVHKIYWPLFHDGADVEKKNATAKLLRSFGWLEKNLSGPFLMGETFTVADTYLLTLLNWTKRGGIDMSQWPKLSAYWKKLRERPSVVAALDAERAAKPKI